MNLESILDVAERELDTSFEHEVIDEGSNFLVELKCSNNTYILKIFDNEASNREKWFRAEPLIYELLSKESSVPVPSIEYIGRNEKQVFYIMEKIEGKNPDKNKENLTASSLENLLYQYGKLLAETHETTSFNHYGILGGRNNELIVTEKKTRWPWSIQGTLKIWKDMINSRWENPPNQTLIPDKNYIRNILPNKPEPVIIHDDNSFENIIVNYNTIDSLLDWAHTRSGHGEYDLVKAEYSLIDWYLKDREEKENLRKALYKGYEKHRTIKKEGFEERKELYKYFVVLWLCAGFPVWSRDMSQKEKQKTRSELVNRLKEQKPSEQ